MNTQLGDLGGDPFPPPRDPPMEQDFTSDNWMRSRVRTHAHAHTPNHPKARWGVELKEASSSRDEFSAGFWTREVDGLMRRKDFS